MSFKYLLFLFLLYFFYRNTLFLHSLPLKSFFRLRHLYNFLNLGLQTLGIIIFLFFRLQSLCVITLRPLFSLNLLLHSRPRCNAPAPKYSKSKVFQPRIESAQQGGKKGFRLIKAITKTKCPCVKTQTVIQLLFFLTNCHYLHRFIRKDRISVCTDRSR